MKKDKPRPDQSGTGSSPDVRGDGTNPQDAKRPGILELVGKVEYYEDYDPKELRRRKRYRSEITP